MRWRIEKEVVIGKGQFICGNKICNSKDQLRSWELNFAYIEGQTKKNALVKLRKIDHNVCNKGSSIFNIVLCRPLSRLFNQSQLPF